MTATHHKSEARLTQRKTCQARRIKVDHTGYTHKRHTPQILRKGDWLQQAEAEVDTPLTPRGIDDCLLITPIFCHTGKLGVLPVHADNQEGQSC